MRDPSGTGHKPRPDGGRHRGEAVLYPNAYVWLVLIAALDLMLTHRVLSWFGGREVNPVALSVLVRFGFTGLVVYKFLLVSVVVGICEFVGRRVYNKGWWLARIAVAISAVPVVFALTQIAGLIL